MEATTEQVRDMIDTAVKREVDASLGDIKKTLDNIEKLLTGDNTYDKNEIGLVTKVNIIWTERLEEKTKLKLIKYIPSVLSFIALVLSLYMAVRSLF